MDKSFLKRRKILYFLILILSFNIVSANVTEKLQRVIYPQELDFKNVKLADALSIISKTSGITIIAESSIKDVTIDTYFVQGQNLKQILEAIMHANNLEAREVNNIIILEKSLTKQLITTGQIIGHVKNRDTNEGVIGSEITLIKNNKVVKSVVAEVGGAYIMENIDPGTYILRVKSKKYGESGDIVEINSGETLNINLLLNSQNKDIEAKKNLDTLNSVEISKKDAANETEIKLGTLKAESGKELHAEKIVLKHAFPSEVKEVISALDKNVEITAVEKQNMVVLKGTPENIQTVTKLIKELDEPIKQVRITAQVLEITGSLSQNLGIDWSYTKSATEQNNLQTGALGIASGIPTATYAKYLAGSNEIFKATIQLLKSTNDAAVSAIPSIVTLNGEAATIKVTEEQKVGETTTEDDDGNKTTEPLYKEAGTTLVVTPTIRDGVDESDVINLDISLEVSSFLTSTTTDSSGGDSSDGTTYEDTGAEQVNKTETKVRVADGGVIFIGGLKRKDATNIDQSIPYLSNLPFIGKLFKYESTVTNSKDLFIQIRAEIVTDENKNKEISVDGFKSSSATVKERIFK